MHLHISHWQVIFKSKQTINSQYIRLFEQLLIIVKKQIVTPATDWQPAQCEPHLSPEVSWDRLQFLLSTLTDRW